MKHQILFFIPFLFSIGNLRAQQVTYIGDSATIVYERDWEVVVIDSVVRDKMSLVDSSCIVYYSKTSKDVAYKSVLKGDTMIQYHYWRNGQLKKKVIWVKEGPRFQQHNTQTYCQNGQLIEAFDYDPPQKEHITMYYCNGNKHFECDYTLGTMAFGDMEWWYEDGKIKEVGRRELKSDGRIYKDGDYRFYNENGSLDSTEVYKNSQLVKTIKPDKK
jgi:antitoxin component YwqK of YwqJK toxin-antitoxin module